MRRSLRAALAVGLGLLAATACATGGNSADIYGHYRGRGDVHATLDVTDGDGTVRVVLSGGGSASLGAAAPADCVVIARGRVWNGTLVAGFEPVKTARFAYEGAQADRERRTLTIRFGPDDAVVRNIDIDGYCGLGVHFIGTYEKSP